MLRRHPEWQAELNAGKTLGVLVHEGGFLAAFSGTLAGRTRQEGFVPPVYDIMQPDSYFLREEAAISDINRRLRDMGESSGNSSQEGCRLRHERRERSRALQQWLFRQYRFLNARGEERALSDIVPAEMCRGGMGDCCAPKLLQEAYRRGLKPLALAEWDAATGDFSPPCTTRCRPILDFMLQGLDVEPDPRRAESERLAAELRVIYENGDFIAVDKPSGLLSVPGREFLPSVQSLMGLLPVHRLDQDTSGIMLLAKNAAEQSRLHRLFESRLVSKRYEALLEHPMTVGEEGDITLPLCPDIAQRPRQMVSERFGRKALTHYLVADNINGHAFVYLYPHTGRTHQLRVHCAHPDGLDNPIVGDRLYGTPSTRLMLHAAELRFEDTHLLLPSSFS